MAAVTEAERDRVRQLHARGLGRNDIARELGRSVSTITAIAKQLDLSFDRSATAQATAAKVIDAKAKRAQIMQALLDDAERLRAQLFAPARVYAFGGKDNVFAEAEVDQPSFRDQRDIMAAVNTALAASLRLDQHDGNADNETVGSLLGTLFDNLVTKHVQPATDE